MSVGRIITSSHHYICPYFGIWAILYLHIISTYIRRVLFVNHPATKLEQPLVPSHPLFTMGCNISPFCVGATNIRTSHRLSLKKPVDES